MSMEALGWYASIFFWLYFTGLGLPPCPEEAGILYAAGLTTLHPELHWWLAWPLTSAGIFAADATLYCVGRLWGKHLFDFHWVRLILKEERRLRLEQKFHDHGVTLLIAARLLPPLRTGVFLLAGTIRYPFTRFLIADGTFAVLGVGVLFFVGAWLIDLLHGLGNKALWIVGPILLVYLLYRYYHYLRQRELGGEPVPPVSVLQLPGSAGPAEAAPERDPCRKP